MKSVFKSILTGAIILFCYSCGNGQIQYLQGKYEYEESGMNETETRSWSITSFLQIESKTNRAIYFSCMNSDVDGGRKLVYEIKYNHDKTISLIYEKCIGFEFPYEEATECISYDSDKKGDKHFVFKEIDGGLQLIWENGQTVKDEKIFKKVDKFSFVE